MIDIYKSKIICLAGVCTMLVAALSCDSDPPTKPDVPTNYTVYVGDWNTNVVWPYEPIAGFGDSFILPVDPEYGPRISADGKSIYVSSFDSTVSIDIGSLAVRTIWRYERRPVIAVSKDNSLIALGGDKLLILRTKDFGIVYNDTLNWGGGSFSEDNKTFYGVSSGRISVMKVRLDSGFTLVKKEFFPRAINQVIVSRDESKWYLYFEWGGCTGAFSVYDVAGDSLTYDIIFSPGHGSMAATPDERYFFFTNPDRALGDCVPPPPYLIRVYESASNSVIREISTDGIYGDDTASYNFPIERLAVTPDGRWLVGPGQWYWGLIVVDITTLSVAKRDGFSRHDIMLTWLMVQTQL